MLMLNKTNNFQVSHLGLMLRAMSSTQASPIVNIPGLGAVEGDVKQSAWSKKPFYQFLGVKFGESPTGELRFKPPVPVQPWEGVKQAKKFGNPAITLRSVFKLTPEIVKTHDVEDCLNLNIYTSDLSTKKPVIVFVHGGAFFEGGAYQHPGDYFLEKDVVLVVPAYRVGPLGFLSTKSDGIPGNAGIFDIKLSLEWVKKNIEAFGGDTNNVTVYGQSAGGTILSSMLLSPVIPHDLFNRVILASGAALGGWTWDDNPEKNAREIAQIAGKNGKAPVEEIDEEFKKMDVVTLYKAFGKHLMKGMPNGLDTVGGHRMTIGGPTNFLPKTPLQLLEAGQYRSVPMIAGVCKHDGAFGLMDIHSRGKYGEKLNPNVMTETVVRSLGVHDRTGTYPHYVMHQMFTPEIIARGLYKEMAGGFIDMCGNTLIKGPVLRFAQLNAVENAENTYLYSFNYKGQFTRFGYGQDTSKLPFEGGVSHDDDNIYLFPWPNTFANLNDDDKKIAQRMVDLWTSFATTGKPSAADVKEWPSVSKHAGPYLEINKECTIGENFLEELTVASREYKEKLAVDQKK